MKVEFEDKETECGTVSLKFEAENAEDHATLELINGDLLPVAVRRGGEAGQINSLALRLPSQGPRVFEKREYKKECSK